MQNKRNLTEGNVIKVLLAFALPFMISNLLQSLYGAVDLWVVGKYASSESVAAVSTGTQVTQIITSLISGLTLGGTVLIGNCIGAGDEKKAKKVIGTTFTGFFYVSLALTFLMLIFVKPILRALNTPSESFEKTVVYVSLCALGNVFICGYNSVSAVLRGCGDSKSPMKFIALSCFLNVCLDFIFVRFFALDVAGTALATVISQGFSMFASVLYLKKNNFLFDFKKESFKADISIAKKLCKIGIPVSFQEVLVRLSFLYIAGVMNNCGLYSAAIVGIGSKYDVFAMLGANSMAEALTAFTAQNMGAGKLDRAKKSLWTGISCAFAFSSVFFLWAQVSPETMIGVFSKDINVINAGIPYFRTASFDYLAVSFVFCLNGYLNGREKTIWTMVSTTFSAVVLRIPLTYFTEPYLNGDLGRVGMIAPFVTVITAVYTLIYVIMENKKDAKRKVSVL